MTTKKEREPTAVPDPSVIYGVSNSAAAFTSSSSGASVVIRTFRLPDGSQMRMLNRDMFTRALQKAGEAK
jgi:hypothetical protein